MNLLKPTHPIALAATVALVAGLLQGCAGSFGPQPWPDTVVSVDEMRPLAPLHAQVRFRSPLDKRANGYSLQGTVMLRMHVDETGRVRRAAVLQGSGHEQLDEAALRAARTARFEPRRRDGVVVPVTLLAPVHFQQTLSLPVLPVRARASDPH